MGVAQQYETRLSRGNLLILTLKKFSDFFILTTCNFDHCGAAF
jgi:hypothetical protein